jgi:hydrogenase maturation protein HypF
MAAREEKEPRGLKIRLYGIVQGVGFRPFVVKLAFLLGITGTVKNSGGLVDITACGTAEQLDAFQRRLLAEKPEKALIVHHETEDIPVAWYDSFTIQPSGEAEGPVFVSPDLCVCDACLDELADGRDERFRHPFISCMACGPRYSIIEGAPYDRDTTTMRDFEMCEACAGQYGDREDRRYHAQTISCHRCGPFLIYKDRGGGETTHEAAFNDAIKALSAGGVVAVKGIGGYHLCCDPFDQNAVLWLRELKHRELKPFAVMFQGLDGVRRYAHVSPQEEALLLSGARPIVLLKQKENDLAPAVCGDSRLLGAFLPYTPLHALLTQAVGPLVMTSANVSEEPIVKDDGPMLAWPGLDGVLYNTRRIAARVDDSVAKVSAGQMQIIRRSRGYAPLPVILRGESQGAVFAAGGQLKSAFCLASGRFAYVGPHIGDLDNDGCINAYRESLERLQKLLRISPELAVCDLHPGYASTTLAEETGLPLLRVQHHQAHIASVMAEHGLEEPVIGVAFDGTGWGCDNTVWGGEFLVCRGNRFERAGHIKSVRFLGGDEGMKDAAKSAMFYLHDAALDGHIRDERWTLIQAALDNGVNTHGNSGMGRLFDAASAVLGVCAYNRYEGECAIKLENLAAQALEQGTEPVPMAFAVSEKDDILVADAAPVISALAQGSQSKEALALGFHRAVADMAVALCARLRGRTGINKVALSGGVFQNAVLLGDMMDKLTARGFAVYTNEKVPPNDGGISLGQAQIGLWHLSGKEYEPCV